jgi:rhamnulokinase
MSVALAIDVGSSTVTLQAGMIENGRLSIEAVHRFPNRTVNVDGRHVWDMDALVEGIVTGLERAEAQVGAVDTLAIDSTAGDFGLLADDELLYEPYFYRDPDLWSTMDELAERMPDVEMFLETGYHGAPGPYHYQTRRHGDAFERADTLVGLPQLLCSELGGEPITEESFATTLRVFDIRSRSWATNLLDRLDLPSDVLPRVEPAGASVGTVDEGVAPNVESDPTIVLPPSHDTASAVGALPLSAANNAFLCTGSWFIPGLELSEPVVTEDAYHTPASNEVGVDGNVRFLHNIPGFSLLEHCRSRWESEGRTSEYEPLLAAAEEVGPDDPLIDVDAAVFMDAQFDGGVEDAIESYCERTDQPVPREEGAITSCLLTSLAAKSAVIVEDLLDLVGTEVERVHLGGGGVRNELFCRRFAAAVGLPVHAGPTEATAIGNVLSQLQYAGEIDDFAEGREYVEATADMAVYEPANENEDGETWMDITERLRALPP